jgi:8-oxo-dGTP pyrophosphatase MutT (NUDIX family)
MLITSRETKRWIVPKGWRLRTPRQTARAEAYEESGVRGKIHRKPLGSFTYKKRLPGRKPVSVALKVFPLAVKRQLKKWPERKQRKTRWFSIEEAATRCSEPALGELMRKLSARVK